MVMETKVLTIDPFVRGYREATVRMHSPAATRIGALARVLVTWALTFKALSAMVPTQMPDSVERAVRELSGTGSRADSTYIEIQSLLFDAVAAVQALPADAQPGEALSALRGRIASIVPIDHDLRRASVELASHVGAFMLMTQSGRGDIDPELSFVLERALRYLRSVEQDA